MTDRSGFKAVDQFQRPLLPSQDRFTEVIVN